MADPELVETLSRGVEAWNKWREGSRDPTPDLSEADLKAFDLSGANFDGADLTKAKLVQANLSRATFRHARLIGANFRRADLTNADFSHANLSRAFLTAAKLHSTKFYRANLSEATLQDADLRNVLLSGVNLKDAVAYNIKYKRRELRGKCAGLRGADSIGGHAILRRDLLDQDYVDTIAAAIDSERPRHRRQWFAWAGPVRRAGWAVLAVVGGVIASLIVEAGDVLSRDVIFGVVAGALLGLFVSSYWGRVLAFWVWGRFDYGRSWARVIVLAALFIGAFGSLYSWADLHHLDLGASENPGRQHWFYPWYVASMGFATLGVADIAEPRDGLGQLLMMANVLAGFTTFGLLLAVLGNVFARRA